MPVKGSHLDDIDLNGFALRLQQALDEKGWTQRDLHRATHRVVSFTTISDWLANRNAVPRSRQLFAAARALHVTGDWLLLGLEPKYRTAQSTSSEQERLAARRIIDRMRALIDTMDSELAALDKEERKGKA